MRPQTPDWFAGIGCRAFCPAEEIAALIRRVAILVGHSPSCLAIPAGKAEEAGPREAAARLGLELVLISPEALRAAQPGCVTRSARAEAATGFASVAEGCALAAAGAGARLVLPRIASAAATCAIATGRPEAPPLAFQTAQQSRQRAP
ncbi:MAG TPA: cobalamin biosynthesis protein [Acetobacteraceae bacterium]|nr:cobalamin biosynthesis protein [Acetobacteraceae bacterium]